MTAFMVVTMSVTDPAWMKPYFAAVPRLLAEHGATPVAASRTIRSIEGTSACPDRVAIFRFPSLDAIDRFMADERYQAHRRAREAGARSDILVFENALPDDGGLV